MSFVICFCFRRSTKDTLERISVKFLYYPEHRRRAHCHIWTCHGWWQSLISRRLSWIFKRKNLKILNIIVFEQFCNYWRSTQPDPPNFPQCGVGWGVGKPRVVWGLITPASSLAQLIVKGQTDIARWPSNCPTVQGKYQSVSRSFLILQSTCIVWSQHSLLSAQSVQTIMSLWSGDRKQKQKLIDSLKMPVEFLDLIVCIMFILMGIFLLGMSGYNFF